MNNSIELTQIGRYDSGIFDEGAAEITAYDPQSQQLFVINGADSTIDILNVSDPTNPTLTNAIDIEDLGGGINSIAIKDGTIAAAIEGESAQDEGSIVFFDIEGNVLNQVTVGALPDMVTFTPDGTKVLVANEGEPDEDDPTVNPEGSISIIDVSEGVEQASVATADFTAFNGQEAELRERGVRIFPDVDFANDAEPEYITVSPDGTQAFVSLQENNAIAVVDLHKNKVVDIQPLGLKDYSLEGNALDASDEDGGINIENEPVFGLYQPDAIAAYEVDGEVYYVTANEGDARDEDERVEDLELDADAFPNAELQAEEELGRLEVSTIDGDTDGDGDYDRIVSYGGRSFSVRDAHGNLVFDSGDDFAQITADRVPELFNSNGTVDSFDTRSDAKGAEPEGVVVGEIDGKQYAFVGLERTGGIMVYDISDPANSEFVQYINPIDEATGDALDLAPEGLEFIAAEDSPNGTPLLTVSNEVSGTVSVYQIDIFDIDGDSGDDGNNDNGGGSDGDGTFTLQLLHAADREAGIPALEDAPNFSAVLNALRDEDADGDSAADYENTLTLSSGDGENNDDSDSGNSNGENSSNTDSGFEPLFGTLDSDEIEITGRERLVFAGDGDDLINASTGMGGNRIYGGSGNDIIILGEGDDSLFATSSGDNLITGGEGADSFWITSAAIPENVNNITDFDRDDVIGIAGLSIGFDDLDITQQESNTLISTKDNDLAILSGVNAESLSADNFAFV